MVGNQVLRRAQMPTPRTGRGDDIVAAIATLAENLPGATAVGVATTGIVDRGELTALNSTTLPIEDRFPLAAQLRERLGSPALFLNDAQAAGWAEYRYGSGRGARSMAFVTVSTGIGGAFVLEGKLQVGARDWPATSVTSSSTIRDPSVAAVAEAASSATLLAPPSLRLPRSNTKKPWKHGRFSAGHRAAILLGRTS